MKKLIAMVAAVAALAGCAVMPETAPAGAFQTESDFSVTLPSDWSRWPSQINPATSGEYLTKDGMLLNRLHFVTIADGQSFVRVFREADVPTYADGASEFEVVEMVTRSLALIGYNSVEAVEIRPATIDGNEGIRFGLIGNWENGLNVRGDAAAVAQEDGLHLILFLAPEMHYYASLADEVDQIMNSMDLAAE